MKFPTACCSRKFKRIVERLKGLPGAVQTLQRFNKLKVFHGIHIEVVFAGAYALLLACIAVILEIIARHSHRRSGHYRHSGFTYIKKLDVWECPTGHHLTRERTDFDRKIAHYRAPKQKCNACQVKHRCTDSEDGRRLESHLDAWLQSELSRFHRGISLTLVLLAVLILAAEMFRYQDARDWMVLAVLLIPFGFIGSRHLAVFIDSAPRNKPDRGEPSSQETAARGKNLI